MQKTLTCEQKEIIPEVLTYCMTVRGKTIAELDVGAGDRAQLEWRSKPVWYTKPMLDRRVAAELDVTDGLLGPDRKSNDLIDATGDEIRKMRKQGKLIPWRKKCRINAFRLSNPNICVDRPDTSMLHSHKLATLRNSKMMKRLFMSIISYSKKDNTYKFALANALLDHCKKKDPTTDDLTIRYEDLADRFLLHYWYQRFKFRIKQDFHTKKQPAVIRILEEVFGAGSVACYDDIPEGQKTRARKKILADVFGHAREKKGIVVPRFQKITKGNKACDNNLFYEYDDDEQIITLHPEAYVYFRKNSHMLDNALLADWVRYLEKANPGLPMLASKIMVKEEMRLPLTKHRDALYEKTRECFYCRYTFDKSRIHVDHFIPFSYIYDNDWWNLVLSCAECNLSKSDSLPRKDPYLKDLVCRNEEYAKSMSSMEESLRQLAMGTNTWKAEIRHHYDRCAEYGFGEWDYRRPGT